MASVQGAGQNLLPGLAASIGKASQQMGGKHIKWAYDFEHDEWIVQVIDFDGKKAQAVFTKKALDDMSAGQFIQIVETLLAPKLMAPPSPPTPLIDSLKAKLNFDGNLHVYDFGDGMLVPVEAAKEIAAMLSYQPPPTLQQMIDDPAYDKAAKVGAAAIKAKVDADLQAKYDAETEKIIAETHKMYPGKVWLVPDELTLAQAIVIIQEASAKSHAELKKDLEHLTKLIEPPTQQEKKAFKDQFKKQFIDEVTKYHNTIL